MLDRLIEYQASVFSGLLVPDLSGLGELLITQSAREAQAEGGA